MSLVPYYDAGNVTLWQGHVLDVLAALPERSVQVAVCSPPYWSLRAYGCAPQIWGGAADCAHEWMAAAGAPVLSGGINSKQPTNVGSFTQPRPTAWRPEQWADTGVNERSYQPAATCLRCTAWMGELGSEPEPESFIAHLVTVFAAVRRVLADDGCLLVNIGDSYAGSGKGPTGHNGIGNQEQRQGFSTSKVRPFDERWRDNPARRQSKGARVGSEHGESGHTSGVTPPPGYKAKDLIGVPWMLAFALRADGWWLRGDYIWAKPNPMPESVTDRCTRSHEYVFHFTKSSRYLWNAGAIRETAEYGRSEWRNGGTAWSRAMAASPTDQRTLKPCTNVPGGGGTRNKRSVWTIATEAYPEAHFATYPTALVEPCILAASRPGDVVLDPFSGSGTTLMVAQHLERRGWGIELNPSYCDLAIRRFGQPALPLETAEET